jgi:hypothetical protein
MAKKVTAPKVASTPVTSSLTGWGGEVVQARVPSGVKIRMTADCDMILKHLGDRDITENLTEVQQKINAAADRRAVVHSFFDGKTFVTVSAGYASMAAKFQEGTWYYIHNQGEVESSREGHQPMKDLLILKLGEDGDSVQCPQRISDDLVLKLEAENIARINYTRLNYPLRTS